MYRQSPFRKWMGMIALGYMGGTIYMLLYARYCFYDQMIETMNINNAQLGLLNTACAILTFIVTIPGAYLADKLDAKKVIAFSIGSITVVTFIYSIFVTSYAVAMIIWIAQALALGSFWACLIKYINGFGGEEKSGESFGIYYLINGIAGSAGNAITLWICTEFGGFRSAVIAMGIITLIGTILILVFLDDEKKLAERGIHLKGDDPIRPEYVRNVLKWPGTYIIFFSYFTTYTLYACLSYFNPYLIDVIGVSPEVSSIYSVIRSYGTILLAPIGGYMADRVFKSTSRWYFVAFSITAFMYVVPLFFDSTTSKTFASIYTLLPAIVILALYTVTYSIIRELHIPATVMGTAIGLGSLSSPVVDGLWPAIFGPVLDTFGNAGYRYIFITLIGICVLGMGTAVWAMEHDRKCRECGRKMELGKEFAQ